jgi:hypothetical protein
MINENAKQIIANLKEEENLNKKPKIKSLVSRVLSSGTMIEMLYLPDEERTAFAVCEDGKIDVKSKISIGGTLFYPIPHDRDLVNRGVILFPSAATEYGSVDELLCEIKTFIHKYLEVPEAYEALCVYYVLLSWLYDKFYELPYLRVLGDYGSGKSRFLRTVGSICYKPMFTSGAASVSSVFRIIDLVQGTMCLDEADFKYGDTTNDFVKILNCGFSKNTPVLRTECINREFQVVAYDVFSPKLLAGRMRFKDEALESRCLVEEMERRIRKDIALNLDDQFEYEALMIRNKLLMFRFRNFHNKIDEELKIDDTVEPRLNQIVVPLLNVIDSEKERERVKKFIKKYNDDLIEERSYSVHADVFEAFLVAYKQDVRSEPTIKSVSEVFNEANVDSDNYTPRKMGWAIRTLLGLKVKKFRDGIRVLNSQVNKDKTEKLKKKFGVRNSERVNDVNVSEKDMQQLEEAKIIFGVGDDAVSDA